MPMKCGNRSSGSLSNFYINGGYSCLSDARNKVKELEINLKGENPIFYRDSITVNYSTDYDSSSFPMTFQDGVVKRIELSDDARSNPDKHIKPLDIVLAVNRRMVHSCVYLGNRSICHVLGE